MEKTVQDINDHAADNTETTSGTSVAIREVPSENIFELDQQDLVARGFFSKESKSQRLSLELRAIKRRLLRRVGLSRRRDEDTRSGNLVLVTSTRPAEGKTYSAVNIALSLSTEDGVGAVLVDADAPRPRVLSHLGLKNDRKGLTNLLMREPNLTLDDCLLHNDERTLALLPVGTAEANQSDLYAQTDVKKVLRGLAAQYPDRLIIVDTPPVLATPDAVLLAPIVDEVVFVVEANSTGEQAVATALDELLDANENVSLILNRSMVPQESAHYYSYDEYYSRRGRDAKGEKTS